MLRFVRVVLPGLLMAAGIIVIAVGGASEAALQVGVPIFSAGAAVWFFNFLYRVAVSGDEERGREDEARQYFAEHGRWPDEPHHGAGGQR